MPSQGAPAEAVHWQLALDAVRPTLPVWAAAPKLALPGFKVNVQEAPLWMTGNVTPPMVRLPWRRDVDGLAVKENATVAGPVPEAADVKLSQAGLSETAVQAQEDRDVVRLTEPVPAVPATAEAVRRVAVTAPAVESPRR